nr:hypothetical protein Iba_chr14bCG17660 [Ipomoea batatas]GME12043.1 hypothetical protein Iba_scaffold13177CG0030 [Ipomoea batatas]
MTSKTKRIYTKDMHTKLFYKHAKCCDHCLRLLTLRFLKGSILLYVVMCTASFMTF